MVVQTNIPEILGWGSQGILSRNFAMPYSGSPCIADSLSQVETNNRHSGSPLLVHSLCIPKVFATFNHGKYSCVDYLCANVNVQTIHLCAILTFPDIWSFHFWELVFFSNKKLIIFMSCHSRVDLHNVLSSTHHLLMRKHKQLTYKYPFYS